jgi:hypothetical protein
VCGRAVGPGRLWRRFGSLGEPSASFQTKVNTTLNQLRVFENLKRDLFEIGIKSNDARKIADELQEATKHAAEALQVIRRTNGLRLFAGSWKVNEGYSASKLSRFKHRQIWAPDIF